MLRTRHTGRGLLGLMAAAGIVAAMACGGGGGDSSTPAAAVGTPGAEGPTGLRDLDHLIQAAVGGNIIELASLAGYQKVPCVSGTAGGSLTCRSSEQVGVGVEVLASSGCQRGWIRPEEVTDTLRPLLPSGEVRLLAVYEPNDMSDSYDGGFGSQYVAVFWAGKRADGTPDGVALHVNNGRMTWVEHVCHGLLELIATSRVKSFIISPVASNGTQAPSTPAVDRTPAVSTPTTTSG